MPFLLHLKHYILKTLPKALRTQALTALTSNFGLVWWVLFGTVSFVGVWFALVILVWKVWFSMLDRLSLILLVGSVGRFGLVVLDW